ncbi:MAG: hypothetical protein AB1714_26315 [Acidobacteriota bacterium]
MDHDIAKFQEVAYFVGALAHGAEKNLGKGSLSICNLAGKKFGMEAVAGVDQTSDPIKAVGILQEALTRRGIFWEFEPFSGERADPVEREGDKYKLRLVFRTCMVRNALNRYAHDQKLSLCYMSHGVFAGAMEKVMPNTICHLEITHAGANACIKELIWEEKK